MATQSRPDSYLQVLAHYVVSEIKSCTKMLGEQAILMASDLFCRDKWRVNGVDISKHFSYYALEGGSGQPRWKHEVCLAPQSSQPLSSESGLPDLRCLHHNCEFDRARGVRPKIWYIMVFGEPIVG